MPATNAKLGEHSLLVLHKLGFDLRQQLDETALPIPMELAKLADEVAGYVEWRQVRRQSQTKPSPAADPMEFLVLDRPLV